MTDAKAYNVTAAHITETPGVCGGKPCIAGRRIKVQNVYIWHELMGTSDRDIAREHSLTLAQVHAALTYAYEHLEQIKTDIAEDERFVEEFQKQYPSKLKLDNGDEN